jgi:hypothetical protein
MLIRDLSKDLDTKAMTAVRGGDNANSVTDTIGQVMNLSVPVGVLAGGPANTDVHVDSKQKANIWNDQYAGAGFPAFGPLMIS